MILVGDIMSTSETIILYIGVYYNSSGYHKYIGDVQYIRGDHDSCARGYQYIGGCSEHQRFQHKFCKYLVR